MLPATCRMASRLAPTYIYIYIYIYIPGTYTVETIVFLEEDQTAGCYSSTPGVEEGRPAYIAARVTERMLAGLLWGTLIGLSSTKRAVHNHNKAQALAFVYLLFLWEVIIISDGGMYV